MPKVDDLSDIGAPAAIQPPATPPSPVAAPKPRPARKAKALTWEQRHVHKKVWFDRDQLAQVQARLQVEGDQTVAALIKELFDRWLAEPTTLTD